MDDFFKTVPKALERHQTSTVDYTFSNGVPKYKLYVRLADDIDPDRRLYIADGMRGFFKSDLTILVDMAVTGK